MQMTYPLYRHQLAVVGVACRQITLCSAAAAMCVVRAPFCTGKRGFYLDTIQVQIQLSAKHCEAVFDVCFPFGIVRHANTLTHPQARTRQQYQFVGVDRRRPGRRTGSFTRIIRAYSSYTDRASHQSTASPFGVHTQTTTRSGLGHPHLPTKPPAYADCD